MGMWGWVSVRMTRPAKKNKIKMHFCGDAGDRCHGYEVRQCEKGTNSTEIKEVQSADRMTV